MELMVIEVHDIPHVPPRKRIVDQLKIHFLKRKNNGGDVLTVIYPTSTPGHAYVIFESAEVPGVLECTHILDVDNRFYPIQVKKADLSQVDMPVKTTLDLRMFSNPDSVTMLLKHYDFKLAQVIPGHLQLTGSFLKLKLVRNELIRLQGQDHQSHGRAQSALHNGSTLAYDMEHDSLKSVSRNIDQTSAVRRHQVLHSAPTSSSTSSSSTSSYRDMAYGAFSKSLQSSPTSYINASGPVGAVRQQASSDLLAHRQSSLADRGASSLSAISPSSPTQPQPTSSSYRDSASDQSQRSLHSSYYSSNKATKPTTDTMQQHTSYSDSASVESPRSLHSSYYSTNGGTSPKMDHHTSYRDSASGGSLRGHSSFDGDNSYSSLSHSSPSSSTGMARFLVETDTLNFILTQQQDVLKKIEKCYDTEMVLKDNAFESGVVTMVTFSGKNCEKAKERLLAIIKELSSSLRTQEIHLKEYDPAEQKQMRDRVRRKDSGVLIKLGDDVIKLVGTSKESFEMKQTILGHNHDPHRGRTLERNSKSRRSASLSKVQKVVDHTRGSDQENQASSAKRYTPSRYQAESHEGQAPQMVQGPEQASNKNARQTRSKSESREKNRTTKAQSRKQAMEPPPSSQEKKPSKQSMTDILKLRDLEKSKYFHGLFPNKKK